jgi:hypothetical protein
MTKTPIKSAEDTVQILIRAVPKSIHNEFKAVCVIGNTTKPRRARLRINESRRLAAAAQLKLKIAIWPILGRMAIPFLPSFGAYPNPH